MRREFCNPLNIPYKFQHYNKQASREAADPTLIFFKGKYYLFASMSAGFYWSEDMLGWQWHENRNLDLYRYAPDVRQFGDYLIFSASDREPCTFWRTQDPFSDQFEKISEPFAFWDPALFVDDDGRIYFYWGCGSVQPIYGQELNPKTFEPIGEKKELIWGQEKEHGWERPNYPGAPKKQGKDPLPVRIYMLMMRLSGRGPDKPYIEGAYMNKWNGKYYLQYAAPGTELATYANGVYVGDDPLGPFTYQAHNPFSSKPGGFITGAGHGSTIEDEYNNLWHASTMRISVNANFERRLGIFPAGLDKDGILFCNQSFADYPWQIPTGKFNPMDIKPQWMLLSYKKHGSASSSQAGHGPEQALDEDIRTNWCAQGSAGEWYQLDLGNTYEVYGVQINFAEVGVPMLIKDKSECSSIAASNRYIDSDHNLKTRYLLEGSIDGQNWHTLTDKRTADSDLSHDYLQFDGAPLRYLRITATELPYDEAFSLSGLRVFGKGNGKLPAPVTTMTAQFTDEMTAQIRWPQVSGAMGYDIKYGIAPDKLYSSYMVYESPQVSLTTLNSGQSYYIRIDSFNETGITEGTVQPLNSL